MLPYEWHGSGNEPGVARKTLAFGASAMFTGIAGGLSAIIIQFVAPGSFDMFLSIFLFVGLVVGGLGSIAGTVVGAAFIVIVPNIASDISKSATGSVYALLLLAMMHALPNGIGGFVEERWKRYPERPGLRDAGSDTSGGELSEAPFEDCCGAASPG